MFASRMNEEKPGIVFGEQCCPVVQHVPPEILEIVLSFGRINWQREIAAALGRAKIA